MNLAVLLRGARGIDYFEFVASKDGVDVNFFTWGNVPPQGMGWRVDINGQATTQQANKLSFKKGDTVRLNYGMGGYVNAGLEHKGEITFLKLVARFREAQAMFYGLRLMSVGLCERLRIRYSNTTTAMRFLPFGVANLLKKFPKDFFTGLMGNASFRLSAAVGR